MEKNISQNNKCKCIFIKGLTSNVRENHIEEIFSSFGKVNFVEMAYKKGHSLGYSIVKFDTFIGSLQAFEKMDGGMIDGAQIAIEFVDCNTNLNDYLNKILI